VAEIALKPELETSPDISAQGERPTARFYRPELDVLRFFAFLVVFFGHLWPPRATAIVNRLGVPVSIIRGMVDVGGLGVYVFFMLSSYLITELLLREKEKTSTIHVQAYYVRRILRIWPLYFLFIGLAFVFGLLIPTYRLAGKELAALLLFSGNWYFAQYGWVGGFTGHLWSISVEEQFYLVWPMFLKLGGRRTLHAGCVALIALSFASIFFLSYRGNLANPTIFTNSFVICSFFALGGMTALWVHGRTLRLSLPVRGLLMIFGISLFLTATVACRIDETGPAIGAGRLMVGYLLSCLGCLSIFFGFLGATVPSWCRGLVYLGKISYGLYVFHIVCGDGTGWLAKDVLHHEHWPLSFPVSFLLTVLCAALSYRFVESPFLKLKERFVFVQSRRV
jgi:peptidoglycan/LPS O-acetylase OafA/YrhL